MTTQQIIIDAGDMRRYRTEIPNLIDDWGLSVYARALYHHYKRTAGDSGVCKQGMRTIAGITGMSVAQVSRARHELADENLITVQPAPSREACEIVRIADIWPLNFRSYGPQSDLTPAQAIALIKAQPAQSAHPSDPPPAPPKVLLPETPPPPAAPEGVTTRNTPPVKQPGGVTTRNRGVTTRNRGVSGRNKGSNILGKNTLRKEQEEEGEKEDLSARVHACEDLPPPPSDFGIQNLSSQKEPDPEELENARILELAAAIAETCGHNLAVLATLKNGKAAKHAEIIDYARRLADLTIPEHWCEDAAFAGPFTPAHIAVFRDYWQTARPVGNAKDDLPHPIQVYERIATRDAMLHITARLAARRRYNQLDNRPATNPPIPAGSTLPHPPIPEDRPTQPPPPTDPEAARLWSTVLADLSLSLQHAVFDNYLRHTRAAAFSDGVFGIIAPNQFSLEWLEKRMNGMLKQRLQTLTNQPITLHFQLES